MGFFSKLFKSGPPPIPEPQKVIVDNEGVQLHYRSAKTQSIKWADVQTVSIVTTNKGPVEPDVWLTLAGETAKCMIPLGGEGYDEVYYIVSKYEGFDFEQAIMAATWTDNREFVFWREIE
jgi:hypothetical protein